MAQLTEDQKLYIVQSLACYDTPSQVAAAVTEEFNIEIDRFHVHKYDPTKVNGQSMAKKYKDIFFATREAFLKDVSTIPIASQSFRLRQLQRIYDNAIQRKNFVLAKETLEQAAKEVGNFYTNKIKLGGDTENPLKLWLQQLGNSSIPIVEEDGTVMIEGEFSEESKDDGKA